MVQYQNIILRPMIESDLTEEQYWQTVDTEWMDWDSPWEDDANFCIETARTQLLKTINNPPPIYYRLRIITETGRHIGSVNYYTMNESPLMGAVGIGIPPQDARGHGYGKNALIAWIAYHFHKSSPDALYTQTWSGNDPMINLAKSIGFEETERIKNIRRVKGQLYDACTYRITREQFNASYKGVVFYEH